MYEYIEKAVKSWKAQNVELTSSLAPEYLEQLFANTGHPLSADVALLYSLCGGMAKNVSDDSFFELWSPQCSLQEAQNFPKPFIPFADGLISAHIFCLKFETQSLSSVWLYYPGQSDSPTILAGSLNEAFGFLLNEPSKLNLPSASLTHHSSGTG